MYVKCTNEATQRLYDEETMGDHYDQPGVEFGDSGVAQVKQEVGEAMIEKFDAIVKHNPDSE